LPSDSEGEEEIHLFDSLWTVCFLHHLQYFFNSNFFSTIFFDL